MKGKSFCSAVKDAFQLILANAARVATVGIISTFLMLLGKLFIVALSTTVMFAFIYKPPPNLPAFFGELENVSSPIFPMLVCACYFFIDVPNVYTLTTTFFRRLPKFLRMPSHRSFWESMKLRLTHSVIPQSKISGSEFASDRMSRHWINRSFLNHVDPSKHKHYRQD